MVATDQVQQCIRHSSCQPVPEQPHLFCCLVYRKFTLRIFGGGQTRLFSQQSQSLVRAAGLQCFSQQLPQRSAANAECAE